MFPDYIRLLKPCTALEVVRLELGAGDFFDDADDHMALSKFPGDLLDHLPATLKVLVLSIGEAKDDTFKLVEAWTKAIKAKELEAKLLKFPQLAQFVIAFSPKLSDAFDAEDDTEDSEPRAIPEKYTRGLRRQMPKLRDAGKLQFPLRGSLVDCVRCAKATCKSRVNCTENHGVEYYEAADV